MMAEKQGITAAEFKAKWESEIPMKRLGEPREFAALAAFLVSEGQLHHWYIDASGRWLDSVPDLHAIRKLP
jgi:NAD(P)-dependent dehydrogenase (short-subunit alcohol dehydrogenase family)